MALWNCFFSPATDITAAAETKHAEGKTPRPGLDTQKTGAKRRPEGLSVISAKTVDETVKEAIGEIKAAGSIFSLKGREDGGAERYNPEIL